MTQAERLIFLISKLKSEQPQYSSIKMPTSNEDKQHFLRALMNVRMPAETDEEFLRVQDEYLQEEISRKGITDESETIEFQNGICLWQGDITTLRCGAIVNAANSRMLGCFVPCHGCIDNAIHTYAGVQLRAECAAKMRGNDASVGDAMVTEAYNLPCDYIIHTVGPIIYGELTNHDRRQLAVCYRSCLNAAKENGIKSIAFCCISTGEFHFPNEEAAKIAIRTVKECLPNSNVKRVIFNVFKNEDFEIYNRLLRRN